MYRDIRFSNPLLLIPKLKAKEDSSSHTEDSENAASIVFDGIPHTRINSTPMMRAVTNSGKILKIHQTIAHKRIPRAILAGSSKPRIGKNATAMPRRIPIIAAIVCFICFPFVQPTKWFGNQVTICGKTVHKINTAIWIPINGHTPRIVSAVVISSLATPWK